MDSPGKDRSENRCQALLANVFSIKCTGKGHELELMDPVLGG